MKNNDRDEIKIDETVKNNPFKKDKEISLDGETVQQSQEEQIEDVNSSENELENVKKEFETLNSQYLRLAADFDNYRKRMAQEREGLINYGKIEALTKLVEVLDNFDRAEQALKDNDDIVCVKEAFQVLQKQMVESLEKVGLVKIETVGKEFDPNVHDAVMQTPTTEYPDQVIIAELQKGYKLGDKVIRPALVNVATN